MDVGRDLDQAAAFTLRLSPMARVAAELDDPTKARIAEAVKEAYSRFIRADGAIAPPLACWLVAARA